MDWSVGFREDGMRERTLEGERWVKGTTAPVVLVRHEGLGKASHDVRAAASGCGVGI